MVRISVPDAHPVDHVALEGTHPNESAMRVGAPRDAHVRIDANEDLTIQIREDEDGRYVGCRKQYADDVRDFFREEYGAEYDTDDGGGEDGPTPAEQIEDGVCPWCGEEYANVGSHAAQAHPDEYEAFKAD